MNGIRAADGLWAADGRPVQARDEKGGTVSIAHIKRGCCSTRSLNPAGIVPLGPHLALADLLAR